MCLCVILLVGGSSKLSPAQESERLFPDPFPSTYAPFESQTTIIQNVTLLTGTGERIDDGSIVMQNGLIAEIGVDVTMPQGAFVIDGTGMWVTPGIIDTHSHVGTFGDSPYADAQDDGNEATDPNTAEVWIEHSIWPHSPVFGLALEGGVTSLHTLPGSANLFGGRGVTLKNVPARTVQDMKFPGAPHGLKMACGENPKRFYSSKNKLPSTAMGNMAGYRAGWIKAEKYLRKWQKWWDDGSPPEAMPDRDLQSETLAAVLVGEVLIQNHCYRADEMVNMINLSKEFDYKISSFHHAVEAYKIRDYLAENDICSSMWGSGAYGFKLESYDGIEENVALVHKAGACAIVHSDDAMEMQRLNQHAAVAMRAAREEGIEITPEEAIMWITHNPAKALGISERVGSLQAGMMADVVLWTGDPFSVYSHADQVFVDGALIYDKSDPDPLIYGDFILGTTMEAGQ